MPIPMPDQTGTPAGDIVHRQVNGSDATAFINQVRQAAMDAGWTAAGIPARNYINFGTTNPANNQTVTLSGLVYTFKTSIINANAREVLIGASAAVSYQRLVNCILDNGSGKGTEYSSGTPGPNPDYRAYLHASLPEIWVEALVAGPEGNNLTLAETVTPNWGIGSTTNPLYGGHRLVCSRSPQGLQVACEFRRFSSTRVNFNVGDPLQSDGMGVLSANTRWGKVWDDAVSRLTMAGGRIFKVVIHRYHLWVYIPASSDADGACCAYVVRPPDQFVAPVVASLSGGGGSVVTVTTDVPHGMVDVGNVYIWGAQGAAVNGSWDVTVTGTNSYTLNGSSAIDVSGYAASTARSANRNAGQISFFAGGWSYTATARGWRQRALGQTQARWIHGVNQHFWEDLNAANAGRVAIQGIALLKWVADRYWFQEAPIAFGTDPSASVLYTYGWLWGAAIAGRFVPVDAQAVDSNGQRWLQYSTEQANAGLWLAIPPAEN